MGGRTTVRSGDAKKRGQNYQNSFKFKPSFGSKVPTPAQVKAKEAPLDLLCQRCHDTVSWKIAYDKYKPLTKPRACRICEKPHVIKAYRALCDFCATKDKQEGICLCTKCGENVKQMTNAEGRNHYATPGQTSKKEEGKADKQDAAVEEALDAMKLRERRQVQRKLEAGEVKYNKTKKCFVKVENEDAIYEVDEEGDGSSDGEDGDGDQ